MNKSLRDDGRVDTVGLKWCEKDLFDGEQRAVVTFAVERTRALVSNILNLSYYDSQKKLVSTAMRIPAW